MTSTSNCMSFLKPLYVRMWKVRASNGKLMSMSFPAGRFRFMQILALLSAAIVAVAGGFEEEVFLFNHLVGARENHGRHSNAKRFGSLDVDHELELGRLLDGQ